MMDTEENMSAPSSSSQKILLQEETLMKYFSGLIQASFGTAQSTKRTNGHMKVHWRVSVRLPIIESGIRKMSNVCIAKLASNTIICCIYHSQ